MRQKEHKGLTWIFTVFLTFQLVSDVLAGRIMALGDVQVSVTVIFFPVTFIIGDVLAEVYGYAVARDMIWRVLWASVAAGLAYQSALLMPSSEDQGRAYATVLGQVPRTLVGGWIAVFAGDITNACVMSRMKTLMRGQHFWLRAITSTVLGQGVNTSLFYAVALSGIISAQALLPAVLTAWGIKILVEVTCLPLTYMVVHVLKRGSSIEEIGPETDVFPRHAE